MPRKLSRSLLYGPPNQYHEVLIPLPLLSNKSYEYSSILLFFLSPINTILISVIKAILGYINRLKLNAKSNY